jgi:hypothetical protein
MSSLQYDECDYDHTAGTTDSSEACQSKIFGPFGA